MADFDPIHVDFILNQDEVKKASANIRKDITGTDASAQRSAAKVGETIKRVYDQNVKEVNEYTAAVRQSEAQLRKNASMVGRSASGFNTLNHSINQISRELPAFAVSAQVGILALSNNIPILADEINKLKRQNEALIASGQKGVPVWKSILKGIFSWQTALSLGVTFLTIYGREFVAWIQKLTRGGAAIDEVKEKQEALNEAMQSSGYKKGLQNVFELSNNFQLVKEGVLSAEEALKAYNTSMGKVVGHAKDLNEAEQLFVTNSDNYVQALLYREAAKIRATKNAEKLVEFAEEERKLLEENKAAIAEAQRVANNINASDIQRQRASVDVKQSADALKKLRQQREEFLRVNNEIFREFKRKELAFGFDFDNTGTNTQKAISNRQALLDKIAALDKEYARKRLSSDEEEIQALKDKFEKVRELVRRFNADPANKGAAIALGDLDVTEQKALSDLKYKQETKAMAAAIQEQRDLYREYETFKTEHGKAAADERFKNELKAFKSYADFLQAKIDENQEAFNAVAAGTASGSQQERVQLLRAAAEDEANVQQRKFDRLIAQLRTYEEQKQRIEEEYEQKAQELRSRYEGEDLDKRLQILSLQKEKELAELNEAAFKESELYRELNERILGMTRRQIQDHLAMLKQALSQGFFRAADGTIFKLTKAQTEELSDVIRTIEDLLKETNPLFNDAEKVAEVFGEIGEGLGSMAGSLRDINPELSEALEKMAELADVAANAAQSVAGFASGDILSGITGALGAISGFIGLFGNNKAARKQREAERKRFLEEIEEYRVKGIVGELKINQLLRERLLLRAKEVELTYEQIEASRKALEENKKTVDEDYERIRDLLDQESYRYRTAAGNWQEGSLEGFDYLGLLRLYEEGKLTDSAAELFEQLRRLKEEGEDIEEQLKALERQADEIWTGTTESSIAEGIINGLRSGYTAVEDFAGDMEKLLQNAILNAIRYQTLEEPLKEFYQQFAEMAESDAALTEAEIEALRDMYEDIVSQAITSYNQLSEILDQDLLSGDDAESGLKGAIQRELTEETASELTGLYRATFDVQKRVENNIQKQLDVERKTMKHAAAIEQHTANTVAELKLAVEQLKAINKNTRQTSTRYDQGI